MSNTDTIFSVRLVIADFYMQKPIDSCYSSFRGKGAKVPVVRIFGSTPSGQKCCLHCHGVFPYFYIPYESKDFDSFNQATYRIANEVDKAINISLGQGSSNAHHVFKIQLVGGIPFYGYHRGVHQFLKIYMFNPRFVRRAANLLQNGAIMGKAFTPFEMHVPYILQFMIDYNLFGMSFLHIPLDVVKFRQRSEDENIMVVGVPPTLTLCTSFEKKLTVSSLEVDISSNFILNRFQSTAKGGSVQSNPGIEAIWRDERLRRRDANLDAIIPPLDIPLSQERPNVQLAESEIYFRTALLSKLIGLETSTSQDETLNATTLSNPINDTDIAIKKERRTFNISKLMANSVYPEECNQSDHLANASFVENHLFGNHSQELMYKSDDNSEAKNFILDPDTIYLDDTIMDEALFLPLTQKNVPLNATLREEDMKLLHVLQQLEAANDDGTYVDLDSTLAPLSQKHLISSLPPSLVEEKTSGVKEQLATEMISDSDSDEDNGNPNDFSVVVEDSDELFLKLTQSQLCQANQKIGNEPPLQQLDGSDDLLRTPKKCPTVQHSGISNTHKRSPRSPRTPSSTSGRAKSNVSRLRPLSINISNSSAKKNEESLPSAVSLIKSNLKVQRNTTTTRSVELNASHNRSLVMPEAGRQRLNECRVEETQTKRKDKADGALRRSKRLQGINMPTADDEVELRQTSQRESSETSPIKRDYICEEEPEAAAKTAAHVSPTLTPVQGDRTVVVTALDLPPTFEEILSGSSKYDIHAFEYPQPFFSNPDDITKGKEMAHTVLRIPGNKLSDYPRFESVLGSEPAVVLGTWRGCASAVAGKRIAMIPQKEAPTRHAAKLWLMARHSVMRTSACDIGVTTESLPERTADAKNDVNIAAKLDDSTIVKCSESAMAAAAILPSSSEGCQSPSASSSPPLTTKKCLVRRRSKLRLAKLPLLKSNLSGARDERGSSNEGTPTTSQSRLSDTSITSHSLQMELERSAFLQQLQGDGAVAGDSGSLLDGTLNNTFGFKVKLENLQQAKSDIGYHHLTVLTLEVFVPTRGDLHPNPELDEIQCLFYAIEHSVPPSGSDELKRPLKACGFIIVDNQRDRLGYLRADIEIKLVPTEMAALDALLELCGYWDPDIFAGYEIEMSSWGYVMSRAKYLNLDIGPLLSRVPTQKMHEFVDEDRDSFTDLDFKMKLCGRILLDVWRLMRSEIALTSYTFENVVYHILHKRCPCHSYRQLTRWYALSSSRWIVLEYYLERVRGTLALLEQLDLIGRSSEMAKLIGIQFYEVFSRGSQFRVESMMLRIAKPMNLVPISPSVQQRAHMRAPEYLPLILEPQSRYYADPVIVLDFQSLYPSMIIAYNYCYSTCLGRVEHLGQSAPFEFGAAQLRVSPAMLRRLVDLDLITISPCGVVFVKASVREGILPRLLSEILATRHMVKQSMKLLDKSDTAVQRILHSRQLGLKLMANVTYGYTAANFSGRMPCVEVGDTVVAKGRETLECAIKLVEGNKKWRAQVVYGDTDSLFVLVPGRSRAQAFKIGEEIVAAVTQQNPPPVTLKLEKVYQPCILQTKKRYVGYMYETPEQAEPVFEAKGIETVRRDGCPAASKMLEKVLRILFETADVSQVKQYVCRQLTKLLSGRTSLQDLIFAKEFRGLNGYKPTACVPALELTRKWLETDPRRVPRSGERVPFVIINGPPGVPLIRLVRDPHDLMADEGLSINAFYYVTKAIIPPLNRCLLLIGADVHEWFGSLPRKLILAPVLLAASSEPDKTATDSAMGFGCNTAKKTISQYFANTNCALDCGRQTKLGICTSCSHDTMQVAIALQAKIAEAERTHSLTRQMCEACCGRHGDLHCSSLDCPVLYVLETQRRASNQVPYFKHLLDKHC